MADLERAAHQSNIGTFFLTVAMLCIMVWPMVWPAPKRPTDPNKSDSPIPQVETSHDGDRAVNWMHWIPPGIVAIAIISAGALNLAAVRTRTKRNTGRPTNQINCPVRLTIIEGALGERNVNGFFGSEARLRVRVNAREPDTMLDSWRLQLMFGGKLHRMMYRSFEQLTIWNVPDKLPNGKTSPPAAPIDTKPSIEELGRKEALPIGVDIEGWIGFRSANLDIDELLGCEFNLSLYAKGECCETTMLPGPWRRRVTFV